MISSIHHRNFKSLADVTVDLSPFTLFVGANASGKTSILEATHDLLQLVSPSTTDPKTIFAGAHDPARVMRRGGPGHLVLEARGEAFGVFEAIVSGAVPGVSVKLSRSLGGKRDQFPGTTSAGPQAPPSEAFASFIHRLRKEGLGSVASLRLDAGAAVKPHYAEDAQARMRPDGAGLPTVIQRLQLLRDGRFEELEAALAEIVPSVRRLRALPHPIQVSRTTRLSIDGAGAEVPRTDTVMGVKLEAELDSGQWIPADLLSEGTVLTLALLTVLLDEAPRTLLIDDLDQGLHPTAQTRLVKTIRNIQSRSPIQVLATTHSPYLVDAFKATEVRVVALVDGATQVRPLSDHPRWRESSTVLDTGEFWSWVGEEWVSG